MSNESLAALMKCSLCLSTYQKPKCLPCIHTFCQDCLEKYQERNGLSDTLPCPLCREIYPIPALGLSGLPNNFFIQNMLELKTKATTTLLEKKSDITCDLCADVGLQVNIEEGCSEASKYCPECNQNLCQSCLIYHGKLTGTKSHEVVELDGKPMNEPSVEAASKRSGLCVKHPNELLRLYCLKCEECVCVSCMAGTHNEHKFEEINNSSSRYVNQFDKNLAALKESLTRGYSSSKQLKYLEDEIIRESSKNEQMIRDKCSKLQETVDKYAEDLLCDAKKFKDIKLKELRNHLDEVELLCVKLESCIRYQEELKETNCHYDIAGNGKELITRAEQLLAAGVKIFSRNLHGNHQQFVPDNGNKIEKKIIGDFVTGGKWLVTVGPDTGSQGFQQKFCRLSLDKPSGVEPDNSSTVSFEIASESAACVVNNDLYAVGVGKNSSELWKLSGDDWEECADMPSGRRGHCVTAIGNTIYVLGGFQMRNSMADRIQQYDVHSYKWAEQLPSRKLCRAVGNATCVTYKDCIYVFGGTDAAKKAVDFVQVYDPITRKATLCSSVLPSPQSLMRAVVYRSKAFLLGRTTCYVYDFDSDVWQERMRFKTNVDHFGLTLDDDTLYISGGGTKNGDIWTCSGDVKSLLVDDILSDNKESEWKHHTTLPTPALIHSFSNTPLYK